MQTPSPSVQTAAPSLRSAAAKHLELYVAYSVPGERWPKKQDARYVGPFTRSPLGVLHDHEQDALGGRPTYWARWRGYDNEVGPWSLACSLAPARSTPAASNNEIAADDDSDDQALKLAA